MIYFNKVKNLFKSSVQTIIKSDSSFEVDEAAFPAYAHRNPLIDYIFWQRIKVAYRYVLNKNLDCIIDFGCGSGVLSYLLSKKSKKIYGLDIEMRPLTLIQKQIQFPENIEFIHGDLSNASIQNNSVDLIYAMDVLEHIDNIGDYIQLFKDKIKDTGAVIVSGPTENILYKIGRKLSGERFTGEYHVNNIDNIKKEFEKSMNVRTVSKIIWPFVLFEVFEATKKLQNE